MARLRDPNRRPGEPDDTPDWAWTPDAEMPSEDELERQLLRQGRRSGDHPAPGEHLDLSPQQLQVLSLLSLGKVEPEIATALGLTLAAVHDSIRQIRRKFDAPITKAVAIAIREKLID